MPVALAPGTKVYLALAPVYMRKGYDGLAALVQQVLAIRSAGICSCSDPKEPTG
jgi:hypothetical protein